MSNPQEMAERHGRGLARLQEISLSACEVLHQRLVEAETPEAAAAVALSLQRMTRACRQAMLVEAKLMKDARAMAREDAEAAAQADRARIEARKARVRHAAAAYVAEACEGADDEAEVLERLDDQLADLALDPGFEATPIEALVAALCRQVGVELVHTPDAPAASGRAAQSASPDAMTPDTITPETKTPHAAPGAAAPQTPAPRLVQGPDFGWYGAPDSS